MLGAGLVLFSLILSSTALERGLGWVLPDAERGAPSQPARSRGATADPDWGLWFGNLFVCRDTVAGVELTEDPYSSVPMILVTFRPDKRQLLEQETRRLVGKPMAIRLDGKIVSEPMVYEPITAGVISLSGGVMDEFFATIREASLKPCASGDTLPNSSAR